MAVHGEQRNYICPDCGKCFKTAATLYSHKLDHKEETPFTCNICSKGFKSKERLAQHQHRHSGIVSKLFLKHVVALNRQKLYYRINFNFLYQ